MSAPESRTFRFPKSRSKRLADAVKLAKKMPGYEKSKSGHQVTFGPGDSASDDLWKLIKIASKWKGAAFLFGEEEVDQEAWENSFRAKADETEVAAAPVSEDSESEAASKSSQQEEENVDEEKAEDADKTASKKEVADEEPSAEESKEESAEPEPEPEPEEKPSKQEPEKAEKKAAEDSKDAKKPKDSKPNIIQINPAPKPEDNSGCGKKVAVLMIAALGLFSILR